MSVAQIRSARRKMIVRARRFGPHKISEETGMKRTAIAREKRVNPGRGKPR